MNEETIQGGTEADYANYAKSLAVNIPEINWKDVGNVALDFTPIIGDIKGGYETVQMIGDELSKDNPNYKLIGILGGMGAAATIIGLVPGAGDLAKKAIMSGAKSVASGANKVVDAMPTYDPSTMGSMGGNVFVKKTGGSKILSELDDTAFRWVSSLASKLDKPADELAERMGSKLTNLEKEFPDAFTLFEPSALLESLEQANKGNADLAIINPETFRKIAAQINTADPAVAKQMQKTVDQYAAEIQSGIPLNNPEDNIPFLEYTVPKDNVAQFVGHDGRHRNRAMEALGALQSLVKVTPYFRGQQVLSKTGKASDVYTETSPMQMEGKGGKKVGSSKDLFKFLSMFGALPFVTGGEDDEQNGI